MAVEPLELRPIDECGLRDDSVALFGAKIYLGLYVKAPPEWREDPHRVRELDWRFQLEGLAGDRGEEK